eukprot:SM000225S07012  [mRNA]  locus=s225:44176:68989:+ [translate_table: standard]
MACPPAGDARSQAVAPQGRHGEALGVPDMRLQPRQLASLLAGLVLGGGGSPPRRRLRAAALHSFHQLLAQVPAAFGLYVTKLRAPAGLPSFDACGLAAALLLYCTAKGTDAAVLEESRGALVEAYVRLALGEGRERPPPAASHAFAPLLARLTAAELAGAVLPPALKMLRRSPELVMEAVGFLFATVAVDLDEHASALLPPILQQARRPEPGRRAEALAAVRGLAARCASVGALDASATAVRAVLAGSEGKLTLPIQRAAMYAALGALASGAPGNDGSNDDPAAQKCARGTADYLLGAYRNEANEEARASILAALGLWVAREGGAAVAAAVPFYNDGLKEKDLVRRSHLKSLRTAIQSNSFRSACGPLAGSLLALVKAGAAKPTQRLDGVLALLLLVRMAASDAAVDEKLAKERVWQLVLQKESPLLSQAAAAKLLLEEAPVLVELVTLAASLLWHPSWEVRRAVAAMAAGVGKRQAVALLDAVIAWLPLLEERRQAAGSAVDDGKEEGSAAAAAAVAAPPPPNLVAGALLTVAAAPAAAVAASPGSCARALLAADHPCVAAASSRRRGRVWQALRKSLRMHGADPHVSLASDPALVCKILLGSNGLLSPRPAEAWAAVAAIASVMRAIPAELYAELFKGLQELSDKEGHDSLTEYDLLVYNTPEGTLSSDTGIYVAEVRQDRNIRQARGRFRMYDSVDEPAVAAPHKQEALLAPSKSKRDADRTSRKDGPKPARKTGEEARQAQLREEAALRAQMRELKLRWELVLDTLGQAAAANPDFAHDHLPELVDFVLPMLTSPLVGGAAYEAVTRLARCVIAPLRHLAADLASAIRMVATASETVLQELRIRRPAAAAIVPSPEDDGAVEQRSEDLGLVERVVQGLLLCCRSGPLPSPTFGFVFPIVEVILKANHKTRLHDDLLGVMWLHTAPTMTLPRPRMLSVLYHVLGCIPLYQDRVLPILRELCRGVQPPELLKVLEGVYAEKEHVRGACLDAASLVPALRQGKITVDPAITTALWLALHDPEEHNVEAAEVLWDMYRHELGPDYAPRLVAALAHAHLDVRMAAARALAAAMDEQPTTVQETLSALFALYTQAAASMQLESATGRREPAWITREGVGLALKEAADVITSRDLPVVATFLISRALADPLLDVRLRMVNAGVAIIDRHGKEHASVLLPIFENYLDKKAADEQRYDLVREGVVVFLGALAKHLTSDEAKVESIIERLLEVLNTPSEAVQRAVSDCLPPLMAMQKDRSTLLVSRLLQRLMTSDKYAERKGAAFGLAGVIKGLGLPSIKALGVIDSLKQGLEDKHSPRAREGALFGLECLSEKMGRLFEPYVIHVLPLLLGAFSDGVAAVREAAEGASRAIMAQLSPQGGLTDKAWRTKQGSVQLLGAMAYCAPRQLGQCLPTIVPNLTEVLTDTHPKVQTAAQLALQQVGGVVKNPEIAALVPTLLVGIASPNEHTKESLDLLLQTTFVNSVDAPSLALVVPIVHRGLRERSAETKKKAAQIVGNMCSLVTEPKDMLPYLQLLLPELKKVLVDPIPDCRAVASKALGSLMQNMGEESFSDIVPWLLDTLKSDSSSVERSGAAQGLSEVMAALGISYFESLLPDVIANCSHPRASVRDGYLTLCKYLPGALGELFQPYLSRVLPMILDGLADENESVRDTSLGAGHIFVEHYALSSLPLLLPAVEEGIFHDNWRIRQSSLELLGDLLFKVAGTSGKVMVDGGSDDEGASTEAHGKAIIEVLGRERRNEVLAALYMIRSDVAVSVRQAALHVWKTVVVNTPRTLKEIMAVLMRTLIASLASTSFERRQVAGRSLGELVRKLGERVLPSIIPILARDLDDDSVSTQVREAAGQAFNTLYRSAGVQAVDEIVPALLSALKEPDLTDAALDGLKQIISVRTAAVLPQILPRLVQQPFTLFNVRALGSLAEVAGPGLASHLAMLLPPLLAVVGDESQLELAAAAQAAAKVILSGVDESGLDILLGELMKGLADPSSTTRKGSAELLGFFLKSTRLDLDEELPSLLSTLIVMLTDTDPAALKAIWDALVSLTSTMPKESLPQYLKVVRDAVSTARDKERRKRKAGPVLITGFTLPKALQPVLQIYLQGLMSGSAELREQSAEGLGELISLTSDDALRPFVVPITGPLIRIVGDRFPWQVKSAILGTLAVIIDKGGMSLKPFLPQLQTTFIKCLQDHARKVRSRAARALGRLSKLSTRLDPLIADLLTGIKNGEAGVKEAMLVALKGVVGNVGKSLSVATQSRVVASLMDLLPSEDDEIRLLAARTLGIALGKQEVAQVVQDLCQSATSQFWKLRHGSTLALASILAHSVSIVLDDELIDAILPTVQSHLRDDKVPVREAAAKGLGPLMLASLKLERVVPLLTELLRDESSDVRRKGLKSLKLASKSKAEALQPYRQQLGPAVSTNLKDSSQPVRLAAERCAFHFFQLSRGPDEVQAAQKYLTGRESRRIAKLPLLSDNSDESEDDMISI